MFGFFVFAILAAIVGEGTGRWRSAPAMDRMTGLARLSDVMRVVMVSGPSLTYLSRSRRVGKTFVLP